MGTIHPLSAKKVIQKLKKLGFIETYQRGSHVYLEHTERKKIVTVPLHGSKDVPTGTLHNIVAKQAGLSAEEFNKA